MSLIIKIAWRNVMRHRGKSVIIGVILFLGALLMTAGNGVISGMDKGLQKNIVEGFTGDIVLISKKQENESVFLVFMGKAVEPVYDFVAIEKVLDSQDYIECFVPVGKNMAMVLNDNENGAPGYSFIMGVDFQRYQSMFPDNMKPIEGRLLHKNERGTIIPSGARKEFYNLTGTWFIPEGDTLRSENLSKEANENRAHLICKDNVVFMGFNNDNSVSDIRLGVKGVVKYRALNTIWGHFVLMDIESYRQCLGYFAASEKAVELSGEEKELFDLGTAGLDDLFSEDALIVNDFQNENKTEEIELQATPEQSDAPIDLDKGIYNMVLVRLKSGINKKAGLEKLNDVLEKQGQGVRAVTWKKAIGSIGSMAVIIKSALFVFVMLLFFVAIIIIINTLSMAALERTSEIGMMRAVGARKGFIRMMFLGETGLLSFAFGGLGILVGIAVVNLVAMFKITSDNDMVQLLFGGDTFHPFLSASDIGLAVIQLVLVTLIAVVYPLKVAGSITPLDAVSRD